MRRNRFNLVVVLALASVAALALAAAVAAHEGDDGEHAGTHREAANTLRASLSGAAEVPGPGDPDGSGRARVRLRGAQGKVCFRLRWSGIGDPNAAHIHAARRGVAGDVVVPLFVGDPVRRACVDVEKALIRRIRRHPRRFYVNIHNEEYPGGAIRGQLKPIG